jgi:LAS superfamily LD-carboxypeptidase LdcB
MSRTLPRRLLPTFLPTLLLLLFSLVLLPPPFLSAAPPASGKAKTAAATPSAGASAAAAPAPATDDAHATQWIVLPQQAHPLLQPSVDAEAAALVLHYPQVVSGELCAPAGRDAPADSGAPTGRDAAWVGFDRDGRRYYLTVALLVRRVEKPADGGDLPIGREEVDRWTPLPLDYRACDLVALDRKWDFYTEKRTLLLRREAAQAAERMFGEAQERDGVRLRVVSSYRSADTQRSLYLDKVAKAGQGQRLVAKPGYSEHQLGTAMDLCAADGQKELQADFGTTPEGKWLRENAGRYGFRLSFTEATTAATGYDPEPWHLRYMGGAAVPEKDKDKKER